MPVKALPLLQAPGAASAFPSPQSRKPGDDSPALICRAVFDEMCLLANGDFVCSSCDTSGQRVYGNAYTDRVADVFHGPRYREMRDWLLKSRPGSWCPAIKLHCPRRSSNPGEGDQTAGGRVKLLKIEPVTYCNIKCPACPVVTDFVDDPVVRERRGHKMLPIEIMLDVVDQLPDLETILYYNFGEPFIHKDTVAFLREVRKRRPKLYIATNTNGLVLTPAQIEALGTEALLDYIVFSIDGAYPESYKKYRVGGDLAKALAKMETLVKTVRAAGNQDRVQVVWQYIFFEWNDSDEELAHAKELAAEIGVPIDWVIPTGYGASKRFTHGSAAFAKLTGGEDSYVHQSAPAKLTDRLNDSGLDELDVFQRCAVSCALVESQSHYDKTSPPSQGAQVGRPFIQQVVQRLLPGLTRPSRQPEAVNESPYRVRLAADAEASITVPRKAAILIEVDVENRLRPSEEPSRTDRFRLGLKLQTAEGKDLRELPGVFIASEASQPGGRGKAAMKLFLTEEPGKYQLLLDIVDEVDSYWFSDRGSSPLVYRVCIE